MKNTLVILFMAVTTILCGNVNAKSRMFKLPISILENTSSKIKAIGFQTADGLKIAARAFKGSISKMPITEVLNLNQLETKNSEIIVYPEELQYAFIKASRRIQKELRIGKYSRSPLGEK